MTKIQNKIILALFSLLLLVTPRLSLAATDLGINANGVWLSVPVSKIEVNQSVRIYARVENTSQEDAIAEVEFYVDDALLGTRTITVLAEENGVAFWDWKTPSEQKQVALTARIHRQEAPDDNPNNDEVTLYQLWVNADTDADQVYNRLDNCPSIVNTDQKDADKDGTGDACEEKAAAPAVVQANPAPSATTVSQSSKDISADPVVTEPIAEPVAEATPSSEAPTGLAQGETLVTSEAGTIDTAVTEDGNEAEQAEVQFPVSGETGEVFVQAEQLSWNTFRFRPSSRLGVGEYDYKWDFGDGVVSSDRVIEHTYAKPGRYSVNLQIIEPDGGIQSSTVFVRVGFFNLANWRLWIIIGLLALIIIVAAMTAGVTDSIVATPGPQPVQPLSPVDHDHEETEIESFSEETGALDTMASTGMAPEALGDELSLLESLDTAKTGAAVDSVSPSTESIETPVEEPASVVKSPGKKKSSIKKKPGKKRTVKVKKVT